MKFIVSETELSEKVIRPITRKPTRKELLEEAFLEIVREKSEDWSEKLDKLLYDYILTEKAIAEFQLIITARLRWLLNQMQVLLHSTICNLRVASNVIFKFISLLFGLCNSQSSYIFHSFWGSSLGRIPA